MVSYPEANLLFSVISSRNDYPERLLYMLLNELKEFIRVEVGEKLKHFDKMEFFRNTSALSQKNKTYFYL